MKLSRLLLTLATLASAAANASAAISVGAGGSATQNFDSRPAATEWSTKSAVTDAAATITSLDARVNTNSASTITTQVLDLSPTNRPNQNALAAWTLGTNGTMIGFIQTRPTGNGYTMLMATLQNDSGQIASDLTIAYNLSENGTQAEQIAGHRVYYSLTGAAGSWTATTIDATLGAKSVTVVLPGGWAIGGTMYVLWVDDNADGGTDRAYDIDDVVFTPGFAAVPLACTLTAPSANQTAFAPATVALAALATGSTSANSVSFYTNGVLYVTDTMAPFADTLAGLPVGTYAIYATAENGGIDPVATSATYTITVRDEFVSYVGGTLTENFDGMGTADTTTSFGWYVGTTLALPTTGVDVTAGDGSAGPNGAILGWNYGLTGDSDRALGTAPTGTDRNMQVRIQNNSGNILTSFEIRFDGEVWRNYTNAPGVLEPLVSYDLGVSWTALPAFNFTQPFAAVQPPAAVNGNDPANRTANIGGVVNPPTPVGLGGIIYIRWFDTNNAGTDGGLAIDNFSFTGSTADIPVAIVTQPASVLALTNMPVTFTVVASGTSLSYFWYFNSTLVSTAGASYTIPSVQPSDVGNYYVVVSNSINAITSDVVSLTVTQQVGWVAFNAQLSANAKVTRLTPAGNPSGPLTNVLFGNQLPAHLTIVTNVGGVVNTGTMGTPPVGTPADTMFTPYVNWTGGNAGLNLRTTGVVSYVFTGLDTSKTYKFAGTSVRAGGTGNDYSNRWTQVELQGAASSTASHTPGVITAAGFPASLTGNQVAFNAGMNNVDLAGAFTGDVVEWISIVPSAGPGNAPTNGTFTVVVQQYTNATPYMPGGITPIPANTYGLGQIRLEESVPAAANPQLTVVQMNPTEVMVSWGADAVGYTLQQNSTDVGNPAGWSNVGVAITAAGSHMMTFPPPDRAFFRLIK